jgi:hypothetical protein
VTRQNDAQPDHPFGAAFAANGVRLSHYAEAAADRRSMVFPAAAAGSPVNGNSPQPSSSAGTRYFSTYQHVWYGTVQ